jgi:hypothetical protein
MPIILEEIGIFVVPNSSFLVSAIGFPPFLCDAGRSVDASVGDRRRLSSIVAGFGGVFDDMVE